VMITVLEPLGKRALPHRSPNRRFDLTSLAPRTRSGPTPMLHCVERLVLLYSMSGRRFLRFSPQ
jgi:hypothetical protein